MIVIRDAQLEAMGALRVRDFESALVRKLYRPSNRWGAPDEADLLLRVRAAIGEAQGFGLESEDSIRRYVSLKLGQRAAFEAQLADKSTLALLKNPKITGGSKIDLLEQRMERAVGTVKREG